MIDIRESQVWGLICSEVKVLTCIIQLLITSELLMDESLCFVLMMSLCSDAVNGPHLEKDGP